MPDQNPQPPVDSLPVLRKVFAHHLALFDVLEELPELRRELVADLTTALRREHCSALQRMDGAAAAARRQRARSTLRLAYSRGGVQ